MKIIIAGSRDFNDYSKVKEIFDNVLHQLSDECYTNLFQDGNIEIVVGGAIGADTLGYRLAEEYKFTSSLFKPKWKEFGKSAGYLRNEDMAKYAQQDNGVLIAFWDGESRGTGHMVRVARLNKLRIFVYNTYTEELEDWSWEA